MYTEQLSIEIAQKGLTRIWFELQDGYEMLTPRHAFSVHHILTALFKDLIWNSVRYDIASIVQEAELQTQKASVLQMLYGKQSSLFHFNWQK